ncbi:cell wall binding repeat-containing protein [Clostridium sp. DL-VIII]|uniref:N-acetylmuramoyl-L-alanine amidase family protein n=1 Tax=Clostridium sp. DL-VIII TaxID=641107 RepID=UPI00023B005C|nr:cadherin-like beta sandwich domain-containing protein [Clostridium sp. DL-VIII]EHI99805.1 cell wall binding repeat-containing protein [Clostridium sp. DL-VIII]
MNKNLKKVIAIALTVSAFGAVIPGTSFGLISTKAYAASGDLTSVKLKTSDGSTIKTYDEDDYKSKNEVDDDKLEDNGIYYAKTSSDTIKVTTKGVSSSHVRIFKSKSNSAKGIKISSSIDLSKDSTTTLIIRTYDDDPGTVKYSDDSYTSQYTIKVKCTATSSNDDEDDEYDDVYLKSLSLSDGNISFSKNTSSYNVNVAESVNKISIAAKPDCDSDEYDDYTVRIDGSKVDEDDKFKKTVSLDKGNNEIKITVEDDDDNKRTYTLNITRGNTNNNSTNNNETATIIKANQWVLVNGQWQYNDTLGKPVKNMWENDYYLNYDGNMATGWQYINENWYYLGYDGAMKKGWQLVNGSWYYLDKQGKMLTGWFRDINGKYYYLYTSSGAMAHNTIINGYKVGSDGAWIS